MRRIVSVCVPFLALALASSACSKNNGASPAGTPASASEALQNAQAAVEKTASYTVMVEQSNFVLASWGGADGGTVAASSKGDIAEATLARTGEPDATYHIVLNRGQTYFQRSTCNSVFRVPGGSADVLRPFLFGLTKSLATATEASYVPGSTSHIKATLKGLGSVTIELDSSSGLPTFIQGQSDGQPLTWAFTWSSHPLALGLDARWDPAATTDRGPGGIPC